MAKGNKKFIPGKTTIRTSGKVIDTREINAMIAAVKEGWWTEGQHAQKFARQFGKYLGVKHVALTNSGSSANLLAMAALTSPLLKQNRIKPSDEVITAAAGFPTTVNPIIQHQCTPVFVDVDLSTLNTSVTLLEKAISKKTKAIFLAHTLGNPFAAREIKSLCKKHHLWLVEDACDALGSAYAGKKIGSWGDIATFSFYPGHHMTTAEGGAAVTNNEVLGSILQSLRNWGRRFEVTSLKGITSTRGKLPIDYDDRYTFYELGYNFKMTDIQAALGLVQLKKLPQFNKIRARNFRLFEKKLSRYSDYFQLPKPTDNSTPNWFGLPLTVTENAPFTRNQLIAWLNKHRIETRLMLAGNLTKQPYFQTGTFNYRISGSLGNTDKIMQNTVWIGLFPEITPSMIDYMCTVIDSFIEHTKK